MSHAEPESDRHAFDRAPGEPWIKVDEIGQRLRGYLIGLGLATLLTAVFHSG